MTDTKADSTALAPRGPEHIELVSPAAFNHYVADMQKRAHVLSPVTQLGSLPAMWKIVPAVIYLNADPAAGEVYRDRLFCNEGEVAPTKVGLRRIAQAGGMDTGATRVDDGRVPCYWSFQGFIKYRGFDGQRKTHTASVEWDLREGSELINRMVKAAERNRKQNDKRPAREIAASQIDAARLNGYRNAEARATNAAIREFGLRQKYTQKELTEKPFVVFNMVANPDMTDPEQRRMVLQHALGGEALLYPSATALPAGEPLETPAANHVTGTIIDPITGEILRDEADKDTEFAPANGLLAEEPPVMITRVWRRSGRPALTTEDSTEPIFMEDEAVAQKVFEAWTAKTPVYVATETRGKERWMLEFRTAEPKL